MTKHLREDNNANFLLSLINLQESCTHLCLLYKFCLPIPILFETFVWQISTIRSSTSKPYANVTIDDSVFSGLLTPADPSLGPSGTSVTPAFVETFPGLHRLLGSTLWRVASSAFVYITRGRLYAGFIDTANRAFARVYSKGEVMIFPRGLIHWQLNVSSVGFCRAKQREARVSDHSSAHVREWCRGRSSPKGISAGRSDCTQACRRVCSHR
ncbi:hypothetical protein SELMODRAFT_415460 [Selaginella moellendorffii]|uniref:Germin-like protein n=1 Tax=Selaginella moellendorffii TaxID=88036 RepID=D8RW67_SELML|nr:hypothetical protein SELMODRAFT_415460 [Selaginella moellendorffii]